jgi:N-methylhydantoinase A
MTVRIASDVGGTFTDVILIDARGALHIHKVPSTPPDFEQAVLQAIEHLLATADLSGAEVGEAAHATTVATNAVLEQRGARTALITTEGFRDVLELRRIRAPQMYDLFFEKPRPLVERYLRLELGERVSAHGEVVAPVDQRELRQLAQYMRDENVESIAVCLLHAYAFPGHEQIVGDFLRQQLPNVPVSLSHEVLRERKEYERTATTVVNAYVRPVMQRYLKALRGGLRKLRVSAPLLIMQSAGGLAPEDEATLRPVYALESGPAAGVLAAGFVAGRLGLKNVITLDVGGTTAKASLIEDGTLAYSPEYEVGATVSAGHRLVGGRGETVRAPSIDIAEVGAGGGSIAYLDSAGGLHIGPRSAGAAPGPACYQRGGERATLTDANVVLG